MAGAQMNDIKSRIKSVSSTMQITKAMELVATSKLRPAKLRAERARPFVDILRRGIDDIASVIDKSESPFLSADTDKPTLYVMIAGDRGLAGGFNSNVFKRAASLDTRRDGVYLPIGRKALDYTLRRGKNVYSEELCLSAATGIGDCMRIAETIARDFEEGKFGEVIIIYTKFISMISEEVTHERLLPLGVSNNNHTEPIIETEYGEQLAAIVPQYVGGMISYALFESLAAECSARRSAMNSANNNAEEMIDSLMLKFNRARQAVITQEITEIVSGAEAL